MACGAPTEPDPPWPGRQRGRRSEADSGALLGGSRGWDHRAKPGVHGPSERRIRRRYPKNAPRIQIAAGPGPPPESQSHPESTSPSRPRGSTQSHGWGHGPVSGIVPSPRRPPESKRRLSRSVASPASSAAPSPPSPSTPASPASSDGAPSPTSGPVGTQSSSVRPSQSSSTSSQPSGPSAGGAGTQVSWARPSTQRSRPVAAQAPTPQRVSRATWSSSRASSQSPSSPSQRSTSATGGRGAQVSVIRPPRQAISPSSAQAPTPQTVATGR